MRRSPCGLAACFGHRPPPGLPDGLFSNQNSRFVKKDFRASEWKMLIWVFYGQLEYFMDIRDIL
jgi:hypothetical protein